MRRGGHWTSIGGGTRDPRGSPWQLPGLVGQTLEEPEKWLFGPFAFARGIYGGVNGHFALISLSRTSCVVIEATRSREVKTCYVSKMVEEPGLESDF